MTDEKVTELNIDLDKVKEESRTQETQGNNQDIHVGEPEQKREYNKPRKREFIINGKTYILKFSDEVVSRIETALDISIEALINKTQGFFRMSEQDMIVSFALKEFNGGYIDASQGAAIAKALRDDPSCTKIGLNTAIVEAMTIDLSFLSQPVS